MPILHSGLADEHTLDACIDSGGFATPGDGAFAIFTASPATPFDGMLSRIQGRLPIRVIGGTSLGNPFEGNADEFISLLGIFEQPRCKVGIALSGRLDDYTGADAMRRLYQRCLDDLGCRPKLFLAILPIVPELYTDHLLDPLFALAGETPVFGGMVSDESAAENFALFLDGKTYRDRIVLVGFGGDVEPVFGLGCQVTTPHSFAPIVTCARRNIVSLIDGVSIAEYMTKIDLDSERLREILTEMPMPVRVHPPAGSGESQKLVSLVGLTDGGDAVFTADVPNGSHLHLGVLSRDDVRESTEMALRELLDAMREKEQNGYHFSTILAVSCVARYYVMVASDWIEAKQLRAAVPPDVSALGSYVFGEICPRRTAAGALVNAKHSQSLGLCAF
ncbi:MAG: FIST C-terminal domain-containing protein, partial [Planctomycetes bacterium]|nr:FIST C-terminal domain-containing protein [Planctomycetota bacterium]